MVVPGDISIYFGQLTSGTGASFFQGVEFFLVLIAVFAGVGIAYYYFSFPLKVTVFPLYGSSKDGYFSVGRPRSNKVKWIRHRTAWKRMKPFMNTKEIEPFDSEFIYPGKQIYAFELNGEWIPGRVNIDKDEFRKIVMGKITIDFDEAWKMFSKEAKQYKTEEPIKKVKKKKW